MPGDPIVLVGDRGGRIRSFVAALGRFPAEPMWAVVGGFAVNVRIAQVHRLTNDLDTVSRDQTSLVEDGDVVGEATAPIATVRTLVALKAVAIPRRSAGNSPQKVGSDIHDLVRLVDRCDFDAVSDEIASAGDELRDWVGDTLVKWFSPDHDLRYTHARLRRMASSPDADALTEDDLAIVADLGRLLQ